MLSRCVITVVASVSVIACAYGSQKDYLQAGEEKPTTPFERRYHRLVHQVLERAYRGDVVLRMVDSAPFGPNWACGLARESQGYRSFITGASTNLANHLYYRSGSAQSAPDPRALKQPLYERPIESSLATRIAALVRRVLCDERNYGKDPHLYIDSDNFTWYLRFLPHERITARGTSRGGQVRPLTDVIDALGLYADGTITQQKLSRAVAKAERNLGI
jgi:hypothetical protein